MTEDRAAGHQTCFFSCFLVPVLKLFFVNVGCQSIPWNPFLNGRQKQQEKLEEMDTLDPRSLETSLSYPTRLRAFWPQAQNQREVDSFTGNGSTSTGSTLQVKWWHKSYWLYVVHLPSPPEENYSCCHQEISSGTDRFLLMNHFVWFWNLVDKSTSSCIWRNLCQRAALEPAMVLIRFIFLQKWF